MPISEEPRQTFKLTTREGIILSCALGHYHAGGTENQRGENTHTGMGLDEFLSLMFRLNHPEAPTALANSGTEAAKAVLAPPTAHPN